MVGPVESGDIAKDCAGLRSAHGKESWLSELNGLLSDAELKWAVFATRLASSRHPRSVEAVRHPVPQLDKSDGACIQSRGFKNGKVASILGSTPYDGQQPSVALC